MLDEVIRSLESDQEPITISFIDRKNPDIPASAFLDWFSVVGKDVKAENLPYGLIRVRPTLFCDALPACNN